MKEIIKQMVADGRLIDIIKARKARSNPLEKISCQIFWENVERLTKGQVGFEDNPILFYRMIDHIKSCHDCTEKFGGKIEQK
ncbi:MAG: hypothetical protein L6Q29_00080 [Candidatus Pacebacteria bacterium]|nr:hypothetical protein [Candidatus Paceibacterota bacterium]NUQ57622.1 hypothetical protein [Candidatus Paceibacter sp.]